MVTPLGARELASVERPTGRESKGHVYLLEGLLRCGSCGATMTRTAGTSRNGGQHYYYRCGGKHRTAGTGCKVRDLPVGAVETFVIDQLKKYALDPAAIELAVQMANAGRDTELAKVEAELAKARAGYAAASRAVTGLVDSVERDSVESGGRAGQGLRARLREREAKVHALRLEVDDLQARRDALQQKLLDAQVVMAGYRSLPEVLDKARKPGAEKELQALLHEFIDVVEWKEDPVDHRRGTATIKIFELPETFWQVAQGQKEEQPREPMPLSSGSLSCPVWLPSVDLNHGPDD